MNKFILILLNFFLFAKVSFSQTLNLANLPLQENFNQGVSTTFTFSGTIDSAFSRNPAILSWTISGNKVTFLGLKPGRTGLRIVSGSQSYFMGIRVNYSNGTMPGLPANFVIGSVSQDITTDLDFWQSVNPGLKDKAMDIRYIYINGGPLTGWDSWGPQRPGEFARNSLKYGLIPFFVYYNIPDAGEGYALDLANAQTPSYMTAYFANLTMFMDSVQNVMQGELYGIILESDFLGYLEQNASPSDPLLIPTAVSATKIDTNAGNVTTLVERINQTILAKRNAGHNVFFGWQQNLWACPFFQGTQGIIRITDDNTFAAGKYLIAYSANQATMYGMRAGILSYGANFISIDKYGLDAMGYQNTVNPAQSTWFWNNDHWNNYLLYDNTIHATSGKPIMLWQLPCGHINGTQTKSAYTGRLYSNLPDTYNEYEDSGPDFFLGDTIVTDSIRLSYFGSNLWNDATLQTKGNKIYWGNHIQAGKNAGIIGALFGAGVNISTEGTGNPPSDSGFWIQKVQTYYDGAQVPLDSNYAVGPLNPCTNGCYPLIQFVYPTNNQSICKSKLDTVDINFAAWDQNGTLTSLTAYIDGTISLPVQINTPMQELKWVSPTSWGIHTLTISAKNNSSLTTTQTIIFDVSWADTIQCGYPQWNPAATYSKPGMMVTYNGLIYENKYWTQGDYPYLGGSSSPWNFIGVCPCSGGITTQVNNTKIEPSFLFYPDPSNGTFTVTTENIANKTQLAMYNILGQKVYQNILTQANTTITLHQPAGIYLYRIISEEGIIIATGKIAIAN